MENTDQWLKHKGREEHDASCSTPGSLWDLVQFHYPLWGHVSYRKSGQRPSWITSRSTTMLDQLQMLPQAEHTVINLAPDLVTWWATLYEEELICTLALMLEQVTPKYLSTRNLCKASNLAFSLNLCPTVSFTKASSPSVFSFYTYYLEWVT